MNNTRGFPCFESPPRIPVPAAPIPLEINQQKPISPGSPGLYEHSIYNLMGGDFRDLRAQVLEHGFVLEELNQYSADAGERDRKPHTELHGGIIAPLLGKSSLEYKTQKGSDGKQQLTIAGTAGRDAIPPSSEPFDGGCGSRTGGGKDLPHKLVGQKLCW